MVCPRTLIVCLLVALISGLSSGTASAQVEGPMPPEREPDPAAIAERCIGQLDRQGENCVKRTEASCNRAVQAIERLLENDKPRVAARTAKRSADSINKSTRRCVASLNQQAERCANLLDRLGAPELAEAVAEAAESNIAAVREARADALAKIREALPERPDRPDRPERPRPGDDEGEGDGGE